MEGPAWPGSSLEGPAWPCSYLMTRECSTSTSSVSPHAHRLCVVGLLHALQQAQVVEEGHELVRLLVAEPVAPAILYELKLGVNALADRHRARLREDHARHGLQLGHGRAVLVPPQVAGHVLGRIHDPLARKDA